MARRLFVKNQTPTIELPVTSIDGAGNKETILVGYKRYPLKEAQAKIEIYSKLDTTSTSDEYLISEIVYIKNGSLEAYEVNEAGEPDLTKQPEIILVADTREITPNEFFQDSKECLVVLLDKYLSSAPWKNSLYNAYTKALLNIQFEEDKLKN